MSREVAHLPNRVHVRSQSCRQCREGFVNLAREVPLLGTSLVDQNELQAATSQGSRGLLTLRKDRHGLAEISSQNWIAFDLGRHESAASVGPQLGIHGN